jgi:quinol monooxygenase YgiN
MIGVIIQLSAKEGREAELIRLLEGARQYASDHEPGCRAYDIMQAREPTGRIVVYQKYASEAALEAHRNTPHARELGARLPEVLAVPGDVEFFELVG